MAYDEGLANRVRQALKGRALDERAMFGGLALMVRGHMCCGLVGDRLMVRVGPDAYDDLLGRPGAQAMDFTGRPMRGLLYVSGDGIATEAALRWWVSRALSFVESQPPKARASARSLSNARTGARKRTSVAKARSRSS